LARPFFTQGNGVQLASTGDRFKRVNSMTEFKQIIGRRTRLGENNHQLAQ
jgi:hypothetical protein